MKAGTTDKLKFKKLQRRLGESRRGTVGLLETLWLSVARNCMHGDIGRFSNEDIATMADWQGSADKLVDDLIELGWLDEHSEFRLVVHNWSKHAPNYVKGNVKLSGKPFSDTVTSDPQGIPPRGHPLGDAQNEPPGDTPQAPVPPSQAKSSQAKPLKPSLIDQLDQVSVDDEAWHSEACDLFHRIDPPGGVNFAFIWRMAYATLRMPDVRGAIQDAANGVKKAKAPPRNPIGYFRRTLEGSIGKPEVSALLESTPKPSLCPTYDPRTPSEAGVKAGAALSINRLDKDTTNGDAKENS